jgi:mannitol operon repressor
LAAAVLDEALGRIIKKSMIANKALTDKLLGPVGPLGSFGSRISICYLLGKISDDEYNDLEIIRSIRNDFAHKIHDKSFEIENIKSRCSNLILAKKIGVFEEFGKFGTRERFDFSVGFLVASLGMRETDLKQPTPASNLL